MTETEFQDQLADLLTQALQDIDLIHLVGIMQISLNMFIHHNIEIVEPIPNREDLN